MARGNERKTIFHRDNDMQRFLEILSDKMKNGEYILFAYCLMKNHIHLIIKAENEDISRIMKRINVSYAIYYNKKYDKVGHVFQDRYKSEPIEDDNYLLGAIRYVHNNPVKANIVKNAKDYPWSSYNQYISKDKSQNIVEADSILEFYSKDKNMAMKLFKEFTSTENDDKYLDDNEDKKEELKEIKKVQKFIQNFLQDKNMDFDSLINDKKYIFTRDKFISELKENTNLSIRKLASLIGVDKNTIYRG